MEIGMTTALQKKTGTTTVLKPEEEELFFCWDGHIMKYGGRQALLVVNAKTRLASLMINLKPRDWKDIGATVREAVTCAMKNCGYSDDQIRRYFDAAGDINFTKTHGRTVTGVMNIYGRYMEVFADEIDKESRYQVECSRHLHGDIYEIRDPQTGEKHYYHPTDYYRICMEKYGLL